MPRPANALIVDDEAHVRVFLRLLLKETGIETVWEAADGTQALAVVDTHQPELVLLDINMPTLNGLDVLQQISAARPNLPVIIVTSQSAMKTVLDTARLGAVAYILKHSPRSEALKILRETLDGLADDTSDASS